MTKKDDELAGFRDFLEKEPNRKLGVQKTQSKHAGFELLSFLELESSRLDKQLNVMEEKSYVLKSCDSFEAINKLVNRDISMLSSEIMRLSYREGSPMMKSLEELFGSLFNS